MSIGTGLRIFTIGILAFVFLAGSILPIGQISGHVAILASHNSVVTSVIVDADASGNSATSLGVVQACREVNVSDIFTVDLVVKDVFSLASFQVTIIYNSSVLRMDGIDVQQFLASRGFFHRKKPKRVHLEQMNYPGL